MAAQSQPSGLGPSDLEAGRNTAPSVACDLCGWPMPLSAHCIEQGEILGLLVCGQCIEDHLQSEIH